MLLPAFLYCKPNIVCSSSTSSKKENKQKQFTILDVFIIPFIELDQSWSLLLATYPV